MKIIGLIFLMMIASCSSNNKLMVKSTPDGAKVKIVERDGEIRELGVTPYDGSLNKLFSNSNVIQLELEHPQHELEKIILTKPLISTDINLSIALQKQVKSNEEIKAGESLEKVAVYVAKIYREITNKNYDEAKRVTNKLKDEYPHLSIVYDFLGNIAYLRGNLAQAKQHYNKASELNPNNFERKVILQKIEKQTTN